ncbi:MAG TPA: hypothetical protein DCL48_12015 [Alphaproteobacteria bacterium]|nr:hypothetical protein [Alphaproteobacteria bacterium]
MQQALLTIGDLPGLRVIDSSVVPVADRPGVFRLIIKIEEDLVEGQVYVDNRDGSEQDRQVSGEVSVNGLFGTGTEIALAAYTSLDHPDRKKFAELSVSAPLGLRGTMVEVTGSTAQSNNGVFGRSGRRESESYELGLGLKHPFIRTSAASLWVNVELLQANEWDKDDGRLDSKDELSILRAGLNTRLVLDEGAVTSASATVSVGRDAFKHRPGSPLANPDDGAAFTKFAVTASHLQPLGGALKVYAAMRGQYSEDNLPDGEQIYFGGARWGRAYDYSEIAGETGLAGQIELRHLIKADALVKHVELYAFADSAATWTRGGEGEPDTLASAGLGVRAGLDDHLTANLEWAKPLTRIPDGQGDLDPRLFASATFAF